MKTNKVLILAILTSILFGCAADREQVTSVVEEKWIVAPTGKPSAPISMKYRILTSTPKVGEEIEVEVSFQSKVESAINVKTNFSDNKLSFLNNNKSWQSSMNKSGVRQALPVLKVVAPDNGLYYIRLVANVTLDGKTLAKPFVIPVKVGDGEVALEPVGEIVIDDKGQKVIIQKAKTEN